MDNISYIEQQVAFNDLFIADTSTLMEPDWLRQFSERAEPIFLAAGKHISIPLAVRTELLRHLDSADDEKRTKAMDANNILAQHKVLFQTVPGKLDDDDIAKAFADAELLALLMRNRSGRRQLLIANDRSLTRDAFELNDLQSCQGGRISVCFIDRFGQLQRCSCVAEAMQKQNTDDEFTNVEQGNGFDEPQDCDSAAAAGLDVSSVGATLPASEKATSVQINGDGVRSTIEEQVKAENRTPARSNWWKLALAFTGGLAVGCYAGVYRHEIAQMIASPLAIV